MFASTGPFPVVAYPVGVPAKRNHMSRSKAAIRHLMSMWWTPKKRKTPHVRRSKRATLPGVINDEERAMLEWEEDEQTLRHGKGLVERSEQEASPFDEVEVNFSDDEYEHEEDGVRPICLVNRPKIDYSWKSTIKYQEDCGKKCYQGERDTFSA